MTASRSARDASRDRGGPRRSARSARRRSPTRSSSRSGPGSGSSPPSTAGGRRSATSTASARRASPTIAPDARGGEPCADGCIVDGYLTHQVAPGRRRHRTGARRGDDPRARPMSQMLVRHRCRQPARRSRRRVEADRARGRRTDDDDVALVVVDLLWLDGQSLLDVPLLERKRMLESVARRVASSSGSAPFVRPPVDTWLGSWRASGLPRHGASRPRTRATARARPGRPTGPIADHARAAATRRRAASARR